MIWRGPGSIYETKRWTNGHIELDSARLDDRQEGGRKFAIRMLSLDESDPPFKFRNARGFVRIQGDSIWAEVPHFELPGSKGNMVGKVWWGNNLPARFDLSIRADTVSMEDIAWVYPTLPNTGGGKMNLRILSQRDPRVIDYIITDMDVRTTDSRLRGDMTFGIGGPITVLKDVDLVGAADRLQADRAICRRAAAVSVAWDDYRIAHRQWWAAQQLHGGHVRPGVPRRQRAGCGDHRTASRAA